MSLPLAEFYAQMKPYLRGEQDLAHTREAMGPSPSGDHDFAFYRVLAERNLFRILRDLYAPLRTLVLRDDPTAWGAIVREYSMAYPPGGHHPNCLGESLSEFLAQRREEHSAQPVVYEEIADFCWVRQHTYSAPDVPGDGFEQRLFVRQYSYRIHDLVAALERDPEAPVPESQRQPQPVILLIYRHWSALQTRLFIPSAAGLVALALRQGEEVPAVLQSIPAEHVEVADTQLVEHGVLGPRPS